MSNNPYTDRLKSFFFTEACEKYIKANPDKWVIYLEPTPTTETPKFLSERNGFTNYVYQTRLFQSEEAIKEYLANTDIKYLKNRTGLIPIPLNQIRQTV